MTTPTTQLLSPPTLSADINASLYSRSADPYPAYRRLRDNYPIATISGVVHLFRYDNVATVLRHPHVSTDDRNSSLHESLVAGGALAPAYLSQMDEQSFLHRDPPDHTRLRKLATQVFTPHRMQALRSFIQSQVDEALDTAVPARRLEIVADLAYPLPIEVICELLGIPVEDRPYVTTWPRAQLCCSFEPSSLSAANQARAIEGDGSWQVEADRLQEQLTDYFAGLIERRRGDPADDVISALIAAEEAGEHLSTEEINATLRLLFVAGYENVVNLIGHGTLALLRHPSQWAELRDDPDVVGGAVDEMLRYDAPFQFTRRVALADLDLGGFRIARGQHLTLWLAAANRDPKQFPDPDRFGIRRTDNHHLAFGSGIHACFGGPLARLEAEVVFTTLTRRLIEPRLVSDPPSYRTDVFRSLAELPITVSAIGATC